MIPFLDGQSISASRMFFFYRAYRERKESIGRFRSRNFENANPWYIDEDQ